MKKITFSIITFVVVFFCSTLNVFASLPPYHFVVSNEEVYWNNYNLANTASFTPKDDDDYSEGTLNLNNYNGGQIKLECRGSGMDIKFYINLIGDNKISVPGGVGIVSDNNIEFIGDGTLTIVSSLPIGDESMVDNIHNNTTWTTKIISPQKNLNNNIGSNVENETNINNESDSDTKKNNNSKNDKNNESKTTNKNIIDNNIMLITLAIVSVVSILSLIITISLLIKFKKTNNKM